jgi:hypothetical protein
VDHPLPWLKYLDADDLDDGGVDFEEMNVESAAGEHLGKIDGFIVDSDSGRPYYVVVDASGWFKTKHFLLPVGHAHLDANNEALRADLTRDRVERFPGFNKDEFDQLSDADLKRFNDETCHACAISGVATSYPAAEPYASAWDRPDFRYPEWWRKQQTHSAGAYVPDTGARATAAAPTIRPVERSTERPEAVIGRGDVSPHDGGRAQPGDVIGIETGGEETHVGETSEDENSRRESAEKSAARTRKR